MIGSVASKTVISMLTTVCVEEGQKPSKTLNWTHYSMKIRAKRKKSLLQHSYSYSCCEGYAVYLIGVIYYELLKPNENITGERYRTQLMRLSRALCEKRPQYKQRHEKVIQQHHNARPHVAKLVKTYLETLIWEVLPHRQNSLDITPSDYYLFRSMTHGLADQQLRSYEDIEKWLDSWIASKDEHFYRSGIIIS